MDIVQSLLFGMVSASNELVDFAVAAETLTPLLAGPPEFCSNRGQTGKMLQKGASLDALEPSIPSIELGFVTSRLPFLLYFRALSLSARGG